MKIPLDSLSHEVGSSIKSRGWKFNKLIKGNEVYGWLTQAEADMLKLAFSLSGKI